MIAIARSPPKIGRPSTQLACARARRCMKGDSPELSGVKLLAATSFVTTSLVLMVSINTSRNSAQDTNPVSAYVVFDISPPKYLCLLMLYLPEVALRVKSRHLCRSRRRPLGATTGQSLCAAYSISSSASIRRDWVTARSSAFAVLVLMTSSNFVGLKTGKVVSFRAAQDLGARNDADLAWETSWSNISSRSGRDDHLSTLEFFSSENPRILTGLLATLSFVATP